MYDKKWELKKLSRRMREISRIRRGNLALREENVFV